MGWENRHYHGDTSDHDMYSRARGMSVTMWLIVVCVVAFFIDGFTGRLVGNAATMMGVWGVLSEWGNFNASDGILGFQLWRLVSYQFLHAGLFHILFNMLILFYLGRMMESYLGSKRFLAFYLISGVGGALLYLILWMLGAMVGNPNIPFLLQTGPDTPLVGASSGIFGILVGVAIIAPDKRIHMIFPPISVTVRALALVLIGIALFRVMVGGPNDGGEAAHLGGALLGFLLVKNPGWLNFADRFSPSSVQSGINTGRFERKRKKDLAERAEIDRILDKVRDQGLASLTRKEKKALTEETERRNQAG